MTLGEYFDAVNQLAGLNGIESFWVRSALLAGEALPLTALTAWLCLKFCPPFRVYQSRVLGLSVFLAFLVWYGALILTVLLLFMVNDELRQVFRSTTLLWLVYLIGLMAFFVIAFSPMWVVYQRGRKFDAVGA